LRARIEKSSSAVQYASGQPERPSSEASSSFSAEYLFTSGRLASHARAARVQQPECGREMCGVGPLRFWQGSVAKTPTDSIDLFIASEVKHDGAPEAPRFGEARSPGPRRRRGSRGEWWGLPESELIDPPCTRATAAELLAALLLRVEMHQADHRVNVALRLAAVNDRTQPSPVSSPS
jgi:hypothetical protein